MKEEGGGRHGQTVTTHDYDYYPNRYLEIQEGEREKLGRFTIPPQPRGVDRSGRGVGG